MAVATTPTGHRSRRDAQLELRARARAALAAGSIAAGASRALGKGGGRAIGGKVALKVMPDLLAELARGRRVSLVSGTNGKTTTTRLLAEAVNTASSVTTSRGGNLPQSLVQPLCHPSDDAVLEVDELWLPHLAAQTAPELVVLLNLSRDQLDRTSEVRRVAAAWRRFADAAPASCHVVANADDPSVVWAVGGHEPVVWVSAGLAWDEDVALCPACGRLRQRSAGCACGFRLPTARWRLVDDVAVDDANGTHLTLDLSLPGRCNVADALMALAGAVELGVDPHDAVRAMSRVTAVEHRYEVVPVDDHAVRLLMGKNPASWLELLSIVEHDRHPVVVCLNAGIADGTDTSWIWDVPFEQLAGRPVVACGERRADLALRLRVAGVDARLADDPLSGVAALPPGPVDVVATYTAFHQVTAQLEDAA